MRAKFVKVQAQPRRGPAKLQVVGSKPVKHLMQSGIFQRVTRPPSRLDAIGASLVGIVLRMRRLGVKAVSDMLAASSSRLLVGGGLAATIVIIAAIWTLSPVDDVVPQKEMKIVKSGNTPPAGSAAPRRLSPVPQVAPVHPAQPLNDPLLEGLIGDDDNMSPNISHSGLHATLRNEGRDQDWARRAEGALLGNIARVPYLDRNVVPRVTCGATLCEVVVTLSSAVTNEQANQALDVLQSAKLLVDRGEESQLDPDYHSVAVGPTDRNKRGTVFVRYIPRLI